MKTNYFNQTLRAVAVVSCAACLALTSCSIEDNSFSDIDVAFPPSGQFDSDASAIIGLDAVYDMLYPNSQFDSEWGFYPQILTGSHPTLDTQASGWDRVFNTYNWNSSSLELKSGWRHAYEAIDRVNLYLQELQDAEGLKPAVKKDLDGQAHALRGFFYHWLATTFGRIPILKTGEPLEDNPYRAIAETYLEMWDFIIEDFEIASQELDWLPMNIEHGRCTKGMALAYLGDAYMWKAYRMTDGANGQTRDDETAYTYYQKALDCFRIIINSNVYSLNPSYTTLWDPASAWGPETIWATQLDNGCGWSRWGAPDLMPMVKFYAASPNLGGFGGLSLSWEWYSCFEPGDKRRAGSCCTAAIPQINPSSPDYDTQYEGWYEPLVYNVHPYLQESFNGNNPHFHSEYDNETTTVWSTKLWRTSSTLSDAFTAGRQGSTPIYWKRMANVLLDYAECCFRSGNDYDGWNTLDQLRQRAFGKLEDGRQQELSNEFLPYYRDLLDYPLPFGSTVAEVPDAKTYYTKYAADKGFNCEVWKVAVNTERRKELNCEPSLRADMQRSGFMSEHLRVNYPKRSIDDPLNQPWTPRDFDFDERKLDFPIPQVF